MAGASRALSALCLQADGIEWCKPEARFRGGAGARTLGVRMHVVSGLLGDP